LTFIQKQETKKNDQDTKSKKKTVAPTFKETVVEPQEESEEATRPRRERKQNEYSPSPSPEAPIRGGKKKGKPEREIKDRRRGDKSDDDEEQGGFMEWIKANWKTTLIITVVIVLFIWVKMKEDAFNRMSMNSTEQASHVELFNLGSL
jgi:hypothetical protein